MRNVDELCQSIKAAKPAELLEQLVYAAIPAKDEAGREARPGWSLLYLLTTARCRSSLDR